MIVTVFSIAALISSVFAIIFRINGSKTLFGIFKPLTTCLIIAIAFVAYGRTPSDYTLIILVSLFFALIGDVFLIGTKYFLYGLISFLFAHIGFTFAFAGIFGFGWNIFPLLILIPIGILFFYYLKKDLREFVIPVAVYIGFILIMNWQAIGLFLHQPNLVFAGIAVASLSFSFSDAIIALNKFAKPFRFAEPLILISYWFAIYIFTMAGIYIAEYQ